MKSAEVLSLNEELARFNEAFTRGVNGIVEAAGVYVRAIDADPSNADRFREHFADRIPYAVWSNLEAVGRKWMHPKLLFGVVGDRKVAATIKRLPYSMQERVFNRERFPLLLPGGETLMVSLLDATPEQAEQMCNGSEIRDEAKQRAWMESQKARQQIAAAVEMPYVIEGGRVTFRRGFKATKSELRRILAEM